MEPLDIKLLAHGLNFYLRGAIALPVKTPTGFHIEILAPPNFVLPREISSIVQKYPTLISVVDRMISPKFQSLPTQAQPKSTYPSVAEPIVPLF